jgi:hypothetical protein
LIDLEVFIDNKELKNLEAAEIEAMEEKLKH